MKKLLLLLTVLILFRDLNAQDLNARVQILSPQLQNPNERVFTVLETNIRDFLNNRRWSADPLQAPERVDCNFVLTINSWDGSGAFKAEAQIQSSRPVYGTNYNTTVLNINDQDFDFTYSEGQPMDYTDQNFTTNLTSLLAFYAYIITGLDYDTFSKNGGTPYYNKAQLVVNNAQIAPNGGWKAFEGLRNRFWLSENLVNKIYAPIRESLYEYHREGLDVMSTNKQKGEKAILNILPKLQKIDKQKQGAMLPQLFFTAKADELVQILSSSSPQERIRAYNLLAEIDPANIPKYEYLKKVK
ncbi:DUF4835 family protein [Flavihumibacter sp. R14]|nr:DUF4835 family protein [Flavihumibacter soli]